MAQLYKLKKSAVYALAVLLPIIAIGLIIAFSGKPNITGYLIFSQEQHIFDFTNPSQYSFNSTTINFTSGAVSLNLQTNTTTTSTTNEVTLVVISAMKGTGNVTNRVIAQGDGAVTNVKKGIQFDVTFNSTLQSNDVIKMYLTGTLRSNLTLCNNGTQCSMPGQYGNVAYTGSNGWYYITINNLANPTNVLAFAIVDDEITFDYIEARHNITTITTTNTTYYPGSAEIETSDLTIGNLSYWDTFTAAEILNSQTINYGYSTNSGSVWNSVPSGANLSSANSSSGKIRFKATLNSNGNATPILNSLRITYQTQFACTESWNCTDWNNCTSNNTQTRTCTDLNSCGTTLNKPNETQTCTYIPPCTENWNCTTWSACYSNNTQTRTCSDLNSCNTTLNKSNETQNCAYTQPSQQLPSGDATTPSSSGGGGSSATSAAQKQQTPKQEAKNEQAPKTVEPQIQQTRQIIENIEEGIIYEGAEEKALAENSKILTGYATLIRNYSAVITAIAIMAMLAFYYFARKKHFSLK